MTGQAEEELLDVVDEDGNPTGETVERGRAHREGIRHRTSHVWLLRRRAGRVEVLLQKRSKDKDSYPGCYDISSAGHITAGSGYTESAIRELKEELGITAGEDELIFCGRRRISCENVFHGQVFMECQVSHVYCMWKDVEPEEMTLQASEIDGVMWIDLSECRRMVRENSFRHCIVYEELEMLPEHV